MMTARKRLTLRTLASAALLTGSLAALPWTAHAADAPTVEQGLAFRPVQKSAEIETPAASEYKDCQMKVERRGETSGWIVLGPAGQPLRRFVDTNGDNVVDQWRYYQHGLEVYRDIDSDFNNKVDQFRWLNTGGSRWGIDKNEDGKIDAWKSISAEEATKVAVNAMLAGDDALLATVLLNADDIKTLGIKDELAKKLLESVAGAGSRAASTVSGSSKLTRESKWMRFDGLMPSVIPVEDGKASKELLVYENVMAIVETGGDTELLQVGEMVRVGDQWKLTQLPKPLGNNQVTVGGILMQPDFGTVSPAATAAVSPESQELLKELQELDQNSPGPNADPKSVASYNTRRAELLTRLTANSKTDDEREQWTRQLIDGLTAAAQTGGLVDGRKRLTSLEEDIRSKSPKSALVPYVHYRRLLTEYSLGMQDGDADKREKTQSDWYANLEEFVAKYPDAEDTAEAIQHLAIGQEFAGKTDDARKWYEQLARRFPDTPPGGRAQGALRRLDLEGKPLSFTAPGLKGGSIDVSRNRGKVVLVYFWSTWCKPCSEELPQLRALYAQYQDRGFEIIGVNLDTTDEPVAGYLSRNQVTWPQVFEPGGLESGPARQFGIISLPTAFLVGKDGKVVSRNISVEDLKAQLSELLKN